jgi:hypothetical protein
MSDLENQVQPLLEPMLRGQTRILVGERQALLALWAFKTATMLEFVYPQERAIQKSDASWVYEHREPPANVMIWIASYRGTERNSYSRHDVMHLHDHDARAAAKQTGHKHDAPLRPPVAYGLNFGVRHVAFQVFGTTEPNHRFVHRGLAEAAFEPIWPVGEAFTWPPTTALDDHSLPRVLEIFSKAKTREPHR